MTADPPEICSECRAVLGDCWIAANWLYCRHSRVMALRRDLTGPWILQRRVKPRRASRHIQAVFRGIRAYCSDRGLSPDVAMAICQRLTDEQRGAG